MRPKLRNGGYGIAISVFAKHPVMPVGLEGGSIDQKHMNNAFIRANSMPSFRTIFRRYAVRCQFPRHKPCRNCRALLRCASLDMFILAITRPLRRREALPHLNRPCPNASVERRREKSLAVCSQALTRDPPEFLPSANRSLSHRKMMPFEESCECAEWRISRLHSNRRILPGQSN